VRSRGSGVASINAVGHAETPIKVGSKPVEGRTSLCRLILAFQPGRCKFSDLGVVAGKDVLSRWLGGRSVDARIVHHCDLFHRNHFGRTGEKRTAIFAKIQ
jgi:hypothetical protein